MEKTVQLKMKHSKDSDTAKDINSRTTKKDNWDKIEISSKIIASILIPLVAYFYGNIISNQFKDQKFKNLTDLILNVTKVESVEKRIAAYHVINAYDDLNLSKTIFQSLMQNEAHQMTIKIETLQRQFDLIYEVPREYDSKGQIEAERIVSNLVELEKFGFNSTQLIIRLIERWDIGTVIPIRTSKEEDYWFHFDFQDPLSMILDYLCDELGVKAQTSILNALRSSDHLKNDTYMAMLYRNRMGNEEEIIDAVLEHAYSEAKQWGDRYQNTDICRVLISLYLTSKVNKIDHKIERILAKWPPNAPINKSRFEAMARRIKSATRPKN